MQLKSVFPSRKGLSYFEIELKLLDEKYIPKSLELSSTNGEIPLPNEYIRHKVKSHTNLRGPRSNCV